MKVVGEEALKELVDHVPQFNSWGVIDPSKNIAAQVSLSYILAPVIYCSIGFMRDVKIECGNLGNGGTVKFIKCTGNLTPIYWTSIGGIYGNGSRRLRLKFHYGGDDEGDASKFHELFNAASNGDVFWSTKYVEVEDEDSNVNPSTKIYIDFEIGDDGSINHVAGDLIDADLMSDVSQIDPNLYARIKNFGGFRAGTGDNHYLIVPGTQQIEWNIVSELSSEDDPTVGPEDAFFIINDGKKYVNNSYLGFMMHILKDYNKSAMNDWFIPR